MVRSVALQEMAGMVGEVLGTSDWLLVDQKRVDRFAEVTGDDLWIHVDVARAEREIGGTIVHGCLTQSLIPYFSYRTWQPTGFSEVWSAGINKLRYVSPVRVGSRLRLTATLTSHEARDTTVRVVVTNVIEVEGMTRPACVAESLTLFTR